MMKLASIFLQDKFRTSFDIYQNQPYLKEVLVSTFDLGVYSGCCTIFVWEASSICSNSKTR